MSKGPTSPSESDVRPKTATAATLAVAALMLTLGLAAPVAVGQVGEELVVDDDGADCDDAVYTTIQAAVDDATAGDTVSVCDGTYNENVVVPPGANFLLMDANGDSVVIQPTAPGPAIRVEAEGIGIGGFIIQGPGPQGDVDGVVLTGVAPDEVGAIIGNDILDVRVGILNDQPNAGQLSIVGNVIEGADVGVRIAAGSTARLAHNNLTDSATVSVHVLGDGVLHFNRFAGNALDVDHDGPDTLDATHNYWGQPLAPIPGQVEGDVDDRHGCLIPQCHVAWFLHATNQPPHH